MLKQIVIVLTLINPLAMAENRMLKPATGNVLGDRTVQIDGVIKTYPATWLSTLTANNWGDYYTASYFRCGHFKVWGQFRKDGGPNGQTQMDLALRKYSCQFVSVAFDFSTNEVFGLFDLYNTPFSYIALRNVTVIFFGFLTFGSLYMLTIKK